MDLPLFAKVLKRHPIIVAVGLLLAVVLAAFSMLRITPHGVAYRQQQQWASYSTFLVTQKGFPWGSLSTQSPTRVPYADPGRLAGLAVMYSQMASSDPVINLIKHDGPLNGTIESAAVTTKDNSSTAEALPFVRIAALSPTPPQALNLAQRATRALETYFDSQQSQAGILNKDRILLQLTNAPSEPVLYKKRSKALPIVVFLAMLFATVLAASLVDNAKRRRDQSKTERGEREIANASSAVIAQHPAGKPSPGSAAHLA
jgi:hypothetical protein